jgi:hypothetical protein
LEDREPFFTPPLNYSNMHYHAFLWTVNHCFTSYFCRCAPSHFDVIADQLIICLTLLQNMFVLLIGNVSLVSARESDIIYMIWKDVFLVSVVISQYQKSLLVLAGLRQPTPLSHVQIENIIWIHYETCIFLKFRNHSNIYIKHSHNITNSHFTFTISINSIVK